MYMYIRVYVYVYVRLWKNFHNLRKILAFERKTVEITSFNLMLPILMRFFSVFSCTIF